MTARKKPGAEGFAISVDALFATIITLAFISLIGIGLQSGETSTIESLHINQAADDAITAMDNSGLIIDAIDNPYGKPREWLETSLEAELRKLLPDSIDFRLDVNQYQADIEACKLSKTFESCFPDPHPKSGTNPVNILSLGRNLPDNKEIFHGKRIVVKSQPGNCEFEASAQEKQQIEPEKGTASLEGKQASREKAGILLQEKANKAIRLEEVEFLFESSVENPPGTPVTQLSCDDEATVTLTIRRYSELRLPVDIFFGAAKNTSMAECAISASREGPPILDSNETGTIRNDFETAFTFNVEAGDPPGAFEAVINWGSGAPCSPNCPEFKLQSPSDINYGQGEATTLQNSTGCNEISISGTPATAKLLQSQRAYYYNNRDNLRHAAIGSSLAETGTWEVLVKNTMGMDYNVNVAYIDNNHWVEGPIAQILPWDEPLSKVDIAKILITEFTARADWKVTDPDPDLRDKYAYAEIGLNNTNPGLGCAIQPSAGLKDARDLGTPISSQLKNLDASILSIPLPYYGYALNANLINDSLANTTWVGHSKYAIIYGDTMGGSGVGYTPQDAINDAIAKSIKYFTIDFNENNYGKDVEAPCQNTELRNYAEQTGGECFVAGDADALKGILDLIAVGIVGDSSILPGAKQTTLTLNFPAGFQTSFLYDFTEENGITPRPPTTWNGVKLEWQNITITPDGWTVKFKMLIPCDFEDCDLFYEENNTIEMPPSDSTISYDNEGIPETQYWEPLQISNVLMLFSDITVNFLGGRFFGANTITVDYEIANIGYHDIDLSISSPDIKFMQGISPLTACEDTTLDQSEFTNLLDAAYGPDSGPNTSVSESKGLSRDGWLCLWIDPNDQLLECNANNKRVLYCSVPRTYGYVFEYWMWEK